MDCFVAIAPLRKRFAFVAGNDAKADTRPRSRGAMRPRLARNFLTLQSEGAGNAGRPMRPIAACAEVVELSTRVSRVTPESPGIPHAMVLTASFALLCDRAFLPPSPLRSLPLKNLTPASGRQDHTTSPSASRIARQARRSRPSHPAPRFVTLRNAPPRSGTAADIKVIWVFGKPEYFCKEGWTEGSINCPGDLPVGSKTSRLFAPTPTSLLRPSN